MITDRIGLHSVLLPLLILRDRKQAVWAIGNCYATSRFLVLKQWVFRTYGWKEHINVYLYKLTFSITDCQYIYLADISKTNKKTRPAYFLRLLRSSKLAHITEKNDFCTMYKLTIKLVKNKSWRKILTGIRFTESSKRSVPWKNKLQL